MKFNRNQFLDDLRLLATMNVPWRHQGSSIETGMDCIGVVRYAVEKQGIVLPDELAHEFFHYGRPPNGRRFLAILKKWLIEIDCEEARPADLMVVFKRKNPQHMVVQMESRLIGEAYESAEGATSKFLIWPMRPDYRVAAYFRIPDEFQA